MSTVRIAIDIELIDMHSHLDTNFLMKRPTTCSGLSLENNMKHCTDLITLNSPARERNVKLFYTYMGNSRAEIVTNTKKMKIPP